jgi:ribose transport system permease protein
MKKLLGVFTFLAVIYAVDMAAAEPEWEIFKSNHFLLGQRIGINAILCLGAGLLIVTGGVDLSMGSVAGFSATLFATLLIEGDFSIPLAALVVLVTGMLIGLLHGFLVTYLGVQAFVVTLCGLFAYRGLARWLTNDDIPRIRRYVETYHDFFSGSFLHVSVYLWILILFAAVATFFLHFTVHGRYFFAIGSNERAARYSGINVDLYKILAYVLCSLSAAIYGLIYAVHFNTAQPSSTGANMELFAIAGAVLGGCSLRGGEGTTAGMVIGAAILTLLSHLINTLEIKDTLEPVVIGLALLFCAILDEQLRRGYSWRDALAAAKRLVRRA